MGKYQKPLGQRVKDLRQARGFTQESLAESAGLSVQYVGSIERGTANPSLSCLEQLADSLEVSVSDLLDIGKLKPTDRKQLDQLTRTLKKARPNQLKLACHLLQAVLDSDSK